MTRKSYNRHIWLSFLLVVILALTVLKPDEGYNIPPFARKYRTSCNTCHIAYPKLNAFGRAFKRNGYFWPGEDKDTDAMMRKDKPVKMGKGLFGKEANIVGHVPLGIMIEAEAKYYPKRDTNNPETTTMGIEEFEFFAGGTLGNSISYLSVLAFAPETSAWELEAGQVIFNDILGPDNLLNIRVGKLMGGPMKTDPHDFLTTTGFKIYKSTLRNAIRNATVANTRQNGSGIEINGIFLTGRVYYGIGAVTDIAGGNFDTNYQKDFYTFLEYKYGGMRLDGIGGPVGEKPWEDNHIKIRGHFMAGTANLGTSTNPINDKRISFGAELEAWYSRMQFVATVFYQIHRIENGFGSGAYGKTRALGFTAELSAILGSTGWFIPSIRWEHLGYKAENQSGANIASGPNENWVHIGTLFQILPNMQIVAGVRLMLHASDLDSYLGNSSAQYKTLDVAEAKLKIAF